MAVYLVKAQCRRMSDPFVVFGFQILHELIQRDGRFLFPIRRLIQGRKRDSRRGVSFGPERGVELPAALLRFRYTNCALVVAGLGQPA